MVIVGAHYLPFVFLYGMRTFAYLAAALVVPGILLLGWVPAPATLGGWLGGTVLAVFAFLLRAAARP
jgi:dolichyl-phosphate-mannose--protein O-mannosyl transferase